VVPPESLPPVVPTAPPGMGLRGESGPQAVAASTLMTTRAPPIQRAVGLARAGIISDPYAFGWYKRITVVTPWPASETDAIHGSR
jgi:hypothetical protein